MSKKLDSAASSATRPAARPPTRLTRGPETVGLTIDVWPTADLLMSVLAVVDKPAHR
ncbi:MAG: hypothetical protein QOI00_1212, partial [Chloroflexota bacterium]|nr:hypothetical protein [Chloroflexota bacterium]